MGSVSTYNDKRDNHLKSPDFFDAATFGTITFKSKAWKKTGDGTFDVTGDLTIHGVTKEVVLKVDLLGFGPGMQGAQLSGWDGSVTLNRSDFGVNGPAMLGKALGNEVVVSITVEADLQEVSPEELQGAGRGRDLRLCLRRRAGRARKARPGDVGVSRLVRGVARDCRDQPEPAPHG